MTKKLFIENLSKNISNYNTPEQAISQANSCDSLSNDIYTDSKRFIYELLQNADDASCAKGKLDFRIDFIDNHIIVSHKGEQFSEVDIKSICSIGDGNKRRDENKTGFKGIGFKSVFAHSESVIIKTGDYCFKFDKNEANKWNSNWGNEEDWKQERRNDFKDDDLKMPWQIIPFWTDIPSQLEQLSIFNEKEYTVSTIIKHNKIESLKKSLIELFSESQIILFLRSKEIKITINTSETLVLEKSIVDSTIVLKRNGIAISEWLIRTEQFSIPSEVQKIIKDDNRYPRKLRESKRSEISFAIQIEKGKLKTADSDKQLIFTYLPTSINHGLPFLINANFLTDAGRENIHIDLEWNQWLFNQIPLKYFNWISELASKNSKYNKQFLSVLPRKLNGFNPLEKKFNEGYDEAIRTIPFVPNLKGDLLKVSDSLFDETNISNFIGNEILIDYINTSRNRNFNTLSLTPRLYPISAFKKLGIEVFSVKDLEYLFTSDSFTKGHNLKDNFSLISFLFDQANDTKKGDEENEWNYLLKETPFIFDEENKLQKPSNIYFPSIEYTNDFESDISIINKTVLHEINKNHQIKNWLESLGVKEPTDINFIEKTIIGDEEFINEENAINVGRYIFNAYHRNLLTDSILTKLSGIKLLTSEGTLKPARECYLSNIYEPKLKLEGVCDIDFYVSEEYCNDNTQRKEWSAYLLRIGVKENVEWIRREVDANKEFVPFDESFFNLIPKSEIGNEYAAGNFYCHCRKFIVHHLSFLTHTKDNYHFSIIFWSKAFEQNPNTTNEDHIEADTSFYGPGYYGHYYKIPINKYTNSSYFSWSIQNHSLLPTTDGKCHKSPEIYNNNIPHIHEIAGKYLPILDYNSIISQEWQDFLELKEQLRLEDYLEILTQIWQDISLNDEDIKENKKRINLIYKNIAEIFPNLNSNDKNRLKAWSNTNKLLARDGTFYHPSELSIVSVDGFNADNLIYTESKASQEVIKVLDFLGVRIIDTVTPKFSNSTISQESLRAQLRHISPLIALVAIEKSKNKNEWEAEYQHIQNKLSEITFYETTEILLSYGNEKDLQARSTYSEGNTFYYVGNWYKPRVLDGLVEPVCKFLGFRSKDVERMLSVLLSDSFEEGLRYLEEKGFDTSIIPIDSIDTTYQERTPNQNIRTYNQTDEDLGKKGELIVFEELKQIYSKKYGQSVNEKEDGFTIGSDLRVIWRNKSVNTTTNHDFKIVENGKQTFIDSKATSYAKNVEKVALYISGSELNLMESAEKYLIARVFDTFANPSVEYIKLELDNITE